jgi:hypothetical protein
MLCYNSLRTSAVRARTRTQRVVGLHVVCPLVVVSSQAVLLHCRSSQSCPIPNAPQSSPVNICVPPCVCQPTRSASTLLGCGVCRPLAVTCVQSPDDDQGLIAVATVDGRITA